MQILKPNDLKENSITSNNLYVEDYPVWSGTLPILNGLGGDVDYSKDGSFLAVGYNQSPYLSVFNAITMSDLNINIVLNGRVTRLKFTPDSNYLFIIHDNYPFWTILETTNWTSVALPKNFTLPLFNICFDYLASTPKYWVVGDEGCFEFNLSNLSFSQAVDTSQAWRVIAFGPQFHPDFLPTLFLANHRSITFKLFTIDDNTSIYVYNQESCISPPSGITAAKVDRATNIVLFTLSDGIKRIEWPWSSFDTTITPPTVRGVGSVDYDSINDRFILGHADSPCFTVIDASPSGVLGDVGVGFVSPYGSIYRVSMSPDGSRVAFSASSANDILLTSTWSLLTAPEYNTGDIVKVYSNNDNGVYEAIETNTVYPSSDSTKWLRLKTVNEYAFLTNQAQDFSENPLKIDLKMSFNDIINSVALFGLQGDTVTLNILNGSTIVYSEEKILLEDNNIDNWYDYYYTPITFVEQTAFVDIPPYTNFTLNIIITKDQGTTKLGILKAGFLRKIGTMNLGSSIGIVDYSKKERDEFGRLQLIERSYAKRAEYDVTIPTNQVSSTQKFLAGIRTIPSVFIGEIDYESSIIFGFYTDFNIVMSSHPFSSCSLTVEEFI